MSIVDRLANLFKSSLDFDAGVRGHSADSDINEAYAELNEFLRKGGAGAQNFGSKTRDWEDPHRNSAPSVPEALRPDFAELGVPFGADEETCKTAYKKLLKLHHPDRHAGHAGNMKKATEKSAAINAAYENIQKWRNKK